MPDIAPPRLERLIAQFGRRRVSVLGDSILDVYVHGTALGKSAETPTIVARELETRTSLGGAFLLVRNLLALGVEVRFVTLVGADQEAAQIAAFRHPRLELILVRDPSRRTTAKKRFWVDGYKLLQFDQLDNRELSPALQNEAATAVETSLAHAESLVISDYRHGMLPEALITRLIAISARRGTPVFVDSQMAQATANHHHYRGAYLLCMNLREAAAHEPRVAEDISASTLAGLRERLGVSNLVVKLGDKGAAASMSGEFLQAPAWPVIAVDTTGAGDAFLAALVAAGPEAGQDGIQLANCWAGLATTAFGPDPPQLQQLQTALSVTEARAETAALAGNAAGI